MKLTSIFLSDFGFKSSKWWTANTEDLDPIYKWTILRIKRYEIRHAQAIVQL